MAVCALEFVGPIFPSMLNCLAAAMAEATGAGALNFLRLDMTLLF